MVVLITGAGGQLGKALQSVIVEYPAITPIFLSSGEADITDIGSLTRAFSTYLPSYCINAAAYTAVDRAESEPQKAFLINATGAENVAITCRKYGTTLIHISTDFVFDGRKREPYREDDATNPLSVYGQSKREGEILVSKMLAEHIIIRTSWLYSVFGNNFMKTMLKLGNERDEIAVVDDQVGSPTNAIDLSRAILKIITDGTSTYGTYHYSNDGIASWFDFASEIFHIGHIQTKLNAIGSENYPTPAKRPSYSVFDKTKIVKEFGLRIRHWKEGVRDAIDVINHLK